MEVCVEMLTGIILCLLLSSGVSGDCSLTAHLFITAPKSMEALSGSCLQIPCNFTPDDKQGESFNIEKPISGIWGKNDHLLDENLDYVVFNSSNPRNKYDMNITGSLRDKNCTTVFNNLRTDYSDQYYFRIDNRGYMATAVCDPLHITVKDDPWSPVIKISGEQKEREMVTITCSAVTPCPHSPPKLTWDVPQDPLNIRETNTDGMFTTKIQYSLTLSAQHDGLQIRCSAVYPVNGGDKMAASNITLSVTYSPKNTSVSVSPSRLLTAGQLVNLSCSSEANPPITLYRWFRISSEGPVHVSDGHCYSFTFSNVTQELYYCEAMNEVGKQNSTLVHLQTEESSSLLALVPWMPVLEACYVLLLVIMLVIFIRGFISKYGSGHTGGSS